MSPRIPHNEHEEFIDKTNNGVNMPQVRCPHCRKTYKLDYYPNTDRKRWDSQICLFCTKNHN